MYALSFPKVPVIIGVALAAALMMVGLGAILTLAITPISEGLGSFFTALDGDRVRYSIKNAGLQAIISVLFSIAIAIPASISLSRRQHWRGMPLLIMIISLAMVLPTTVAAMGLLAVWGRNGVISWACGGFCDVNLYGLHGVVIAHMMLNVPLAMRVMMPLLQSIPDAKWRLSAHLGMTSFDRFRHIEWPSLRGAIPGLASLIFLLCFTSFSLVLMLGGGPKVTTLEVEIYSAIRFDFNLTAAAGLSLIQFALTALVVAGLAIFGGVTSSPLASFRPSPLARIDLNRFDRGFDLMMIVVIIGLMALPVVMVAIKGFNLELLTLLKRPQFLDALKSSASVAIVTSGLVTILALLMATAKAGLILPYRHGQGRLARYARVIMDQGVMLYLVIPSVVLGTSAFILLRAKGDVFGYAFGVVVMANTLLALPFAYRLLERRMITVLARHDRLALQLGITGLTRLKTLTLPALRQDIGLVAGLSAALSLGDLGVIALFANADFRTLPWLLYQLSGKYAAAEANALALVLLLLTLSLFVVTRVMMQRLLGGRYA
jgi:thiamine transport system permease protein